ncbi:MAG: hypothetical protein J5584_06675 [Clostridia bacterium]|nr:hypothetical protein [Clostridia bacterium]
MAQTLLPPDFAGRALLPVDLGKYREIISGNSTAGRVFVFFGKYFAQAAGRCMMKLLKHAKQRINRKAALR